MTSLYLCTSGFTSGIGAKGTPMKLCLVLGVGLWMIVAVELPSPSEVSDNDGRKSLTELSLDESSVVERWEWWLLHVGTLGTAC